jgi:MoaA/NifB/PqqE/SkfB family radical SAM enzyme
MEIEFDVTKNIYLPSLLFEKQMKDCFVVLASEYPNWIILNEDEYGLFQYLKEDTLLDSLLYFQKASGKTDEEILTISQSLLTKIEEAQFYLHTPIIQEEKISNIAKKIHINLTNNCNLRCKHCYLSAGTKEIINLDYKKLISFLDRLYQINGNTEVVISGGEPLCYNNIFETIAYLKNQGHKVILFTNGTMINSKNIKYIEKNCDEIQLSMEGISKYYYESIRGEGNYPKLLNAIDLINNTNMQLTLAITILKSTFSDVENRLLEFLEILEVKKINIRINDDVEYKGNAKQLDPSNFIFNHARKYRINSVIKNLNKNGYIIGPSRARNIHFSNCGIGTNIVINFDEKVYPCSKYEIDYSSFTLQYRIYLL